MATSLKPIETQYRGYRFRSRLEARWAVFFDALDLDWEYEPDGYKVAGEYYLPDFWIPSTRNVDGGYFVEIKPFQKATDRAIHLAQQLSIVTECIVFIFAGDPMTYESYWFNPLSPYYKLNVDHEFSIYSNWLSSNSCLAPIYRFMDGQGSPCDIKRVYPAAQKARSARFEHGEHGR